jgi:hypothetical protein
MNNLLKILRRERIWAAFGSILAENQRIKIIFVMIEKMLVVILIILDLDNAIIYLQKKINAIMFFHFWTEIAHYI